MKDKIPRHIAVIMDGNGRWAKIRHLPRIMGHRAGAESVREIVRTCLELHIPYLTLYAFSQENWKRPKPEIRFLWQLLENFLDAEAENLQEERIRFLAIGRLGALPQNVQAKIQELSQATRDHRRLTLVLALNYGARGEIVDAVKAILSQRGSGVLRTKDLDGIDEEVFSGYLYTAGLPDPDMLIRTSGEMRLSNFLLWQCSYSEIYISKKLWPDFKGEDLRKAIREFGERERRFGAVKG